MAFSLWDKTDAGARNLVQMWADNERLSQVARAVFDAQLDILAKTAPDVVTHTGLIRGPIRSGVYKLQAAADSRVFVLFLCRGPGEPSGYTLLQGALEVGGHIHPQGSPEKARTMREELIIDPRRRCQHERFGQELTTSMRDRGYRSSYSEEFMSLYLAIQITVVRQQRGLTQAQLAALVGTTQARISRLERANQRGQDLESLRRVGSELGLRLKVDFDSFGSLLEDLGQFSTENLKRPTIEEDLTLGGALIMRANTPWQESVTDGRSLIDPGLPELPTKTAGEPELMFKELSDQFGQSGIAKPEATSQRNLDPTVTSPRGSTPGQLIVAASNSRAASSAEYDVFLSHASEDKETIARPLHRALTAAGISVWFDQAVLKLGDSLSSKIDEGLARCSHGIVIISPSFLRKQWTRRELAGLVAREVADGTMKILPIWHDIDHDTLVKSFPTLADRVAGTSDEGVEELVRKVLDAINPFRSQ